MAVDSPAGGARELRMRRRRLERLAHAGAAAERHHADGSIDHGFGTNGAVVSDTDPPYGAQDTGFSAVVLAPAGRLTAAGLVCRAAFVCDAVVARYGDGAP